MCKYNLLNNKYVSHKIITWKIAKCTGARQHISGNPKDSLNSPFVIYIIVRKPHLVTYKNASCLYDM